MTNAIIPPAGLNEECLSYALDKSNDGSFSILTFTVLPGNPSGNNYCSEVYKVNVSCLKNGEEVKFNLFVKLPLATSNLAKLSEEAKLIEKEAWMYNIYFLQLRQLDPTLDVLVNSYASKSDRIVILEDLSNAGYAIGDKLKKLDFDHSAVVLRSLARLHAASVALHKRDPSMVENVGENFIVKSKTALSYHKNKILEFSKFIRNFEGFEQFSDKFEKLSNICFEIESKIGSKRSIMVMNHGDLHTDNILFKHKNNKIVQMKFIDFQTSQYGSIGIDLNYFIWISTQPIVVNSRLDELHTIYLDTFNSYLEQYGCEERMSQAEFQEEIRYTLFRIVYAVALTFNLLVFSDKDECKKECDEKLGLNAHEVYKETALQAVSYLNNKGFFDSL